MSEKFDVVCIGLLAANIPIYHIKKNILETDVSLVNRMDIIPGGDALNQAVILSRFGRKVSICGKVGPDVFGRCLSDVVRQNNVDLSSLIIDNDVYTSSAIVLIQADGSRNFLSYREATEKFSPAEIIPDKVFNARLVSIGSLLALPLLHGDILTSLMKNAKERGCITAADTKHDTYKIGWEGIRESVKYLDYFLPSYDEAAYLSGETDKRKIAGFFLDAGAKNVVVKLGGEGCYYRTQNGEGTIPTVDAKVVDTTGAGDNFVAGFLHGVLSNWDVSACCKYANAVGAISTTKIGATTAVESEAQVNEYIRTH